MKHVTFLLGAGASIPAGYSSTHCLTERIRAPIGFHWRTDGRYYPGCPRPETDFRTPLVRRIIRWLYKRAHEYFLNREEPKEINYEDLYYLASQLRDDQSELQNPAVLPLICNLKCEMTLWPEYKKFCERSGWTLSIPDPREFHLFCEETCHYIEDIVANVLSHDGNRCTKHLEIIKAISKADDLDLKSIATLAHDTHVEKYLRGEGIKLADGFNSTPTDCNWRIWNNHFPENGYVSFLKLHGSVNWKNLKTARNDVPPFTIGIDMETSERPESWHKGGGNSDYREIEKDRRPLLLISTFNKPSMYLGI